MLDLIKKALLALDWRTLIYKEWKDNVKPKLMEYALKTDNNWDDLAVGAIDTLIEKFVKP